MYQQFTDRARKVMQLANQEAQRFNHEYIGTEHILLGLAKEGSGVAANVLKNLDIDLRMIRLQIERIVQSGPDMVTMGKLPQTPRAKKVIENSIEEARNLNHNYVGTEHLLLGLLREQETVAAQVLMNLGLMLDEVREEILNLLGHHLDMALPPRGKVQQTDFRHYEDFQHWPEKAVQAVQELNARIAQLNFEKEQAVAEQDFEEAAYSRDRADKLEREKRAIICKWRERVETVATIRDSASTDARAIAEAVLAGDWTGLPMLADALEEIGNPFAAQLRSWIE